ncbi:alpha/beta hydrolase family protein [Paenibacillus sp. Soil522]|uniref:alpha/beta hydrolase family protein n=1 Tax=Paenibacillus sp. Soil522 TaxID=1736388 RepID=UPI000702112C|nr:dienelactone hydrolase family protein [Paenibacillus sp. Soil522]KRE38673.1 dienelactone hydrolase [Paenibacillus sp. Soil522]
MWNPDSFVEQLLNKAQALRNKKMSDGGDWNTHRLRLRQRLTETLGDFSDYANVPLDPHELERAELDSFIRERVEYRTADGLLVPAYVVSSKESTGQRRPAILALHGHGWGSREMVGLLPDGSPNTSVPSGHGRTVLELAARGFVVLIPEIVGFGDRLLLRDEGGGDPKANSCFPLAAALLLAGKTLAGLRVYEASRAIDYLAMRTDVDADRIGVIGFSGGGMVASLAAALDERLRTAAIFGYTNTYRASILNRRHCLDNYLPGVLQYAEMPELLGLIAPRPLFIESGKEDPLFPARHVIDAVKVLKDIYRIYDCEERVTLDLFEGAHEIKGRASFDWLQAMV